MRSLLLTLLALLCFLSPAHAISLDKTDFSAIPVLHEGRIKPLSSFADAMHWRITGKQNPAGISTTDWLAEILFDPLTAAERRQFTIRNPELRGLLNLPPRKNSLYDLTELSAGLAPHAVMIGKLAASDNLSKTQEQLLALQQAVIDYTQLMRSLSLLLPLSTSWQDETDNSYLNLRRFEESAQNQLAQIIKNKGEDFENYSESEKGIAQFSMQMAIMRGGAAGNNLFRIIPAYWQKDEWLAPWALLESGQSAPETFAMLENFRIMATAWASGNQTQFAQAASNQLKAATPYINPARLEAEQLYNKLAPLDLALYGYLLTLLLAAITALRQKPLRQKPLRLATATLTLATLIHLIGMGLRVYILERPPVGTLYETVLFVSLIIAGTILITSRRHAPIMAAGAGCAAALLIMAPALIRGGDTMPVLVAVLNTNFWLATHVIIITAGYGFSLLCALAAHIWLAAHVLRRPQSILLAHRLGLLALLFTTVGTILGGIWADQSWGRFWGWDPKENGALLIVLWLVWVMHGRRATLLSPALYAAGLAGLSIIVALAWFGVNLLNVGLHSYGFTSGIFTALVIFCAAEIALIGSLLFLGRKNEI